MVKPMTVLLAALSLPAVFPRPAGSQQPDQPAIAGYGIDVEHVHTRDPGGRWFRILFPNAEALDKGEAARQKNPIPSPSPFLEVTVAGAHRDMLERMTHLVRK